MGEENKRVPPLDQFDHLSGTKYTRALYGFLETLEGRSFLTRLYRDYGMTDMDVAKKLDISRRTLYSWRKKSEIIEQAVAAGKDTVDTMVENKLLEQALNGNVGAICFWLKNRKPDRWKDNPGNENMFRELADKINIEVNYK